MNMMHGSFRSFAVALSILSTPISSIGSSCLRVFVLILAGRSSAAEGQTAPGTHLPAALFDFEEYWDLVNGRGSLIGAQAGAYPQPVSDAQGRGMAVRSGVSGMAAVSLDRVTTLALEQFQGRTYRPGLPADHPLDSSWTGLKLTRRVAPGTTLSVSQLVGDAAATGLTLGYGRAWGRWEADTGFWISSNTANMGLDTSSSGFDASLSRAISPSL